MSCHKKSEPLTRPFIKWPGGKRWIAPALVRIFAESRARYVEPFVGSGATFFALAPQSALLSDCNTELINLYSVVRNRPLRLADALASLRPRKDSFNRFRTDMPSGTVERAARMLYLTTFAFNGLYRVNRDGQFNVPYGPKPRTRLIDVASLRACSKTLKSADVRQADFRTTLAETRLTDLVYLDPPYTVAHDNNGFRRYNESLFSWTDQVDLASWAARFADRGGRVVVSNAFHDDVRALYPSRSFVHFELRRYSAVAASSAHRGERCELLAVSRSLGSERDIRRIIESDA